MMTEPSWLDRARSGDAEAIATLLTQALKSRGITVQGTRQGRCLVLRLESQTLLEAAGVVKTIQQGMGRLQVNSIGNVQVHYTNAKHRDQAWSQEIVLPQPVGETAVSTVPNASASSPSPSSLSDAPPSITHLEQAYHALQADPDASLDAIEAAYLRLRTELLDQGKQDEAIQLKVTHALFKNNFQPQHSQLSQQAVVSSPPSESKRLVQRQPLSPTAPPDDVPEEALDEVTVALEVLVDQLRSRGLESQARFHKSQLQIRLEPGSTQPPNRAVAIIYTLIELDELVALRTTDASEVAIYGMASPNKIGWKRLIPMPSAATTDNRDLMSFKNSHINTFGFPVLMLVGILMNAVPIVDFLLRGVKIWFHEFGHATIAWLGGRRAIPLPFGWTSVDPQRSLFVYLGLLFLLGLLFWAGRREQKRWPMVLAGVLVLLQFCFTWLLPEARFETLLSFGGIGGELYLCTLLMVSFYLPLPAYWRWDFYRYPVVIGAAFTFWGQVWLWRQIRRGVADIPWGSMWGGPADGDMNNLSYAGWSNQQIIGTYSTLANLCLLALIGVYVYFGIQRNRHYWFALSQRWLSRG